MNNKRLLYNALAFVIPLLLVAFTYGDIFLNPSDYMFSNTGDGVKNYYALAWFVEHNNDWLNHTAMNYPYGEHYIYTDGFLPLGWLLKAMNRGGAESIGFANFLMLMGLVFGAFFLFKILRHYKVPYIYALLGAMGIIANSPQVYRMGGHFSLSLMFFFPLSLWLFLKYLRNTSSWPWTIIIALNTFFWFLFHPYLGAILMLFFLSVWLVILVKNRKLFSDIKVILQLLVQTVLPIIGLKLFITLTDTHTLRPDTPSGFWENGASFKSVFLADSGPFLFFTHMFDTSNVPWEAKSYIGFAATLFIVFYLFKTKKTIRQINWFSQSNDKFELFIIPSVLVLIFSFGFPFYQIPILADWLSPVRNFRVLGRFAWAFYYIITLFSIIKLSQWSMSHGKRRYVYIGAIIGFIGLMFVEGTGRHFTMRDMFLNQKNIFKPSLLSEDAKQMIDIAKKNSYLSILPIPFYHVGSERYTISAVDDGLFNSMLVSYHTGLPILSNHLSRTSLTETKKSMMTVSPIYYERKLCDDIDSGDLLIVHSKGDLKKTEARYMLNSHELFSGEANLREIEVNEICKTLNQIVLKDSMLTQSGNLLHSIGFEGYLEYFDLKGDNPKGQFFDNNFTILKAFTPNEISVGTYEVTIWYRNPEEATPNDAFFLETNNKDGSEGAWEFFETLDKSTMFSGDSLIFTKNIVIKDLNRTHKIVIKKSKYDSPNIRYLNMLIRKSDQDVYIMNGDSVSVNNHRMILLK